MNQPRRLGYSFLIALPPAVDERLRAWTTTAPGASWDVSGGHVTLARFTGDLPPEALAPAFRAACQGLGSFEAGFCAAVREPYWDKPGLEIVMLVGETPEDVAGVLELRNRLLAALAPLDVTLLESGDYLPHITLTTGLPPHEALALESAASTLDLRFTAREIHMWSGAETEDPSEVAEPPWHPVERAILR
jgi:hypothetical protein